MCLLSTSRGLLRDIFFYPLNEEVEVRMLSNLKKACRPWIIVLLLVQYIDSFVFKLHNRMESWKWNIHLLEGSRALLFQFAYDNNFGEIVSCCLINRILTNVLKGKPPFELLFSKAPNYRPNNPLYLWRMLLAKRPIRLHLLKLKHSRIQRWTFHEYVTPFFLKQSSSPHFLPTTIYKFVTKLWPFIV